MPSVSRSRIRAFLAATAALTATALGLAGCSAPALVAGTTVTVALSDSLTSLNPNTSFGNDVTNGAIRAATNSQFAAYDSTPKLVRDSSFGSWQVVSQVPFAVKYTIAPGVVWSDGTPVDAADLMLAWVANSGARNTAGVALAQYSDDDGRIVTAFPPGVVRFDGFSGNGLQLVKKTPVVGDGGRSLTLTYEHYFADWQLVFEVGLPAHIVAGRALALADPMRAKAALLSAVRSADAQRLAKIAGFWNTAYNVTTTPKDRGLLVSNGPYRVVTVSADRVVLQANHHYTGAHSPRFERVVVRFISDPLAAVTALADGSVDVISPAPSRAVNAAIRAVAGAKVTSGFDGSWEHLDLQFTRGRNDTFTSAKVRQAFLSVVPRKQLLDQLITPLEPGAVLRDSQVFLPGSTGYSAATTTNGSARYETVNVAAAKALLVSAGVTLYQFPVISATSARVTRVTRSPLPPGLLGNIWAWTPVAP